MIQPDFKDYLGYFLALDIIGGLSKTSKMPWYSWSISARACKIGSELRKRKGTVCSKCYACKGNYGFPSVVNAHARRLTALDDRKFVDAFCVVLQELYLKDKSEKFHFRWFDSGDLQSVENLEKIVEIARRLPYIKFWLPTREVVILNSYMRQYNKSLGIDAIPSNLTIRVSNTMIGDKLLNDSTYFPQSTVGYTGEDIFHCPASKQGNKCGDCRNCWDRTKDINYPLH